VAQAWWDALGPDEARALMAADNEPGETAVRVNTLRADPKEIAAALRAHPAEAPSLPDSLLLDAAVDLQNSDLFTQGLITPQSRASTAVGHILDPHPNERILDLCAAPGAKAAHLAALMDNQGEIVAVERNASRAAELRENLARLGADIVGVVEGDARDPHGTGFDRVLVDPPCSGLGTLRGHPDLRWRATPQAAQEMAHTQLEILTAAAKAVRPGGTIVYSTCTIHPPENEDLVAAVQANDPALQTEDLHTDHPLWKHPTVSHHLLSLPHRHGTDGFFIARLRRAP